MDRFNKGDWAGLRELIAAAAPQLSAEELDSIFDYRAYLEHVPEVMARLDEIG